MSALDNKVVATRRLPQPASEIQRTGSTAPNPSERGMNAPAIPPSHAASGMNDTGTGLTSNGPGVTGLDGAKV
jgi:hypothetical protein